MAWRLKSCVLLGLLVSVAAWPLVFDATIGNTGASIGAAETPASTGLSLGSLPARHLMLLLCPFFAAAKCYLSIFQGFGPYVKLLTQLLDLYRSTYDSLRFVGCSA